MHQPVRNRQSAISNPLPLPAALGYSMPPEWRPHDATWIAWPHNRSEWPAKFEPIPWIIAEIVRLLAYAERVHLFIQPSRSAAPDVRDILRRADVNLAHVTFHLQPINRSWTRDSGPIFMQRKIGNPLSLVDFKFNAWARYDDSALDDRLPEAVAHFLRIPRFAAFGRNNAGELQRFVLEGGSIDVNGAGCLLTTEECLLSKIQQRNPGFSRARIEQTLRDYLGVREILWLGRGIAGDDTHGHVDDIARFVDPTTIVAAVERDRRDVNHAPLADNLKRLARMRDARGKPFTIIELPMPAPVYFNNRRLPATYANFYIANAGVLVPVFNDPNDARALALLEQCFKDRPILPIYCRDLVLGRGTLHCMTQQQPAL